MHLNWLDYASIAFFALVAAIQFLRAIQDFSRVFYETILLIAAAVLAVKSFQRVHELTHISNAVSFLGVALIAGAVGLLFAALINTRLAFGFGAFGYLLGLFLAVGSAYAVGHIVLRTAYLAYAHLSPAFYTTVRRSWMARDLLYFRTFTEVLAMLRVARWLNM